MASGTTAASRMDFTDSNKGRGSGAVTTDAINRGRGVGDIFLNPITVAMVMTIEVASVTIGA